MKFFRKTYFGNLLSRIGILIALVAGMFHITLFFMGFQGEFYNPYMNIWLHIALPPVVVAGFSLALFGAWRMRRRIKNEMALEVRQFMDKRELLEKHGLLRPGRRDVDGSSGNGKEDGGWHESLIGLMEEIGESFKEKRLPRRSPILGFAFIVVLLVPFVAMTSYEGYRYTDSAEFCGRACHAPMKAPNTAYRYSPHARVPCSSCHIGEGASWFVRSKLSGTRQVFATVFNTYHRPIKTPLENLRPARDTCEKCHWPDKAFGDRVVDLPHFASDEKNTPRPLTMVLHTGGGPSGPEPANGIHWHIASTQKTEYIAVDHKREVIPWVRVTTEQGVRVFRSDGLPEGAPPPEGEIRTMDCIDCHNRPSHHYRPPDQILNRLFASGTLDRSWPFIKREAARLMADPHEDGDSAGSAIAEGLRSFYEANYPDIMAAREHDLEKAIEEILHAFEYNIFPEMKTDWRAHPDHIGHKYTTGCFRCHDDRHRAADGSVISKTCESCHDFLERKKMEGNEEALVRGEYRHPYVLEKGHLDVECHACHDGGPTPPPTCEGCHVEIRDFIAGTLPILPGLAGEADPMDGELECLDCHDGPQGFEPDEVVPFCAECHDEEEGPSPEEWVASLEKARREAKGILDTRGGGNQLEEIGPARRALDLLDRLGPVHNMKYALETYEHIGRTIR